METKNFILLVLFLFIEATIIFQGIGDYPMTMFGKMFMGAIFIYIVFWALNRKKFKEKMSQRA